MSHAAELVSYMYIVVWMVCFGLVCMIYTIYTSFKHTEVPATRSEFDSIVHSLGNFEHRVRELEKRPLCRQQRLFLERRSK